MARRHPASTRARTRICRMGSLVRSIADIVVLLNSVALRFVSPAASLRDGDMKLQTAQPTKSVRHELIPESDGFVPESVRRLILLKALSGRAERSSAWYDGRRCEFVPESNGFVPAAPAIVRHGGVCQGSLCE